MGRFYLNLSGSARNPDEPKPIIICAGMADLQLSDRNSGKLCREALDNLVDVTGHTLGFNLMSAESGCFATYLFSSPFRISLSRGLCQDNSRHDVFVAH